MKKEILFAVIAGGSIGLIIAFGAWKLNSSFKSKAITTSSIKSTAEPQTTNTPNQPQDFKVVLAKPINMAVLNSTPTEVSGLTSSNSWVVVSGIDVDSILNASSSGSFSTNIDLVGGANQINVAAFNLSGDEADTSTIAVYSSQFSAPNGISYIGTVTDISNSVIQIKNEAGEIQQISGSSDATYINLMNDTSKTITAADIAIGDYIVAMGTKNSNNILVASRILVTDPLTKTTRRAVFGVVTDDSGINKFIMKNQKTGETITVTPATGVTVSGEVNFGKISNNEKVIAAGEFKNGTLTARTIQVIK